jgi:PadR family transcriptional regulator, regulatory protein PadR
VATIDTLDLFCNSEEMKRRQLNDVELLILLALIRLAPEAYGVPIAREIEVRAQRGVALGTVYAVLDRLEAAGFVSSELGESSPERGGRARRYFQITPKGLEQVRTVHTSLRAMSAGLKELRGSAL